MERSLRRILIQRVEHYRFVRRLWDHNLFQHKTGTPQEQFKARGALDNLVPAMADAVADLALVLEEIKQGEFNGYQFVEE